MAAESRLPENIRNKVLGENRVKDGEVNRIFDKFSTSINKEDGSYHNKLQVHIDHVPDRSRYKLVRHTSKRLSYSVRRKLGLYSIGRKSLKYEDLLPLHSLWEDYIKKYIGIDQLSAKGDGSNEQAAMKLFRADYHGAEITVNSSTCPGYVGQSGIVAMETKNCFLLVGKDNITRRIPKGNCEFMFEVDKFRFSFYGKNFTSRPADRSSKKIKTIHPSYL
ncbi:UNVERIFIED_CONTAM: hypothetical protein PYX00_009558 [Menopon gallinae]|uniref:Ribonuclease P protein subunit p29 n=1 Tax=Menopon gallinae TaxID=328185 RepID=A0AAW2HC10_9NEOP